MPAKSKRLAASAPKAAPPPGAAMEKEETPPLEQMEEPIVELQESTSGVQNYEVSGKWTIPSDGETHPVPLTLNELKTTKEYYWNAASALGVIARNKIINNDTMILPGNAKVYANGEFIGETSLERIAPKEEFKLGAREEMKVKAEKKLLSREKQKTGLIKGKRAVSYDYQLKIENYLTTEAKFIIKDVIPYSRSEHIKIKGFSSSKETSEENLGIYTWEVTVKPEKKQEIKYHYDVEWEKDYTITPSLP